MKRILKYLFAIPVLALLFLSTSGVAQPIAHSRSHADSRPPVNGGTAPIGGGLFILLTMAAGYGMKKILDARNGIGEDVSSE
ncbi:MAG: hypothetical protein IPH20_25980 [Bacteroidales bacterium]|nr:hypothetical protein [Bacteroidales bacterium]